MVVVRDSLDKLCSGTENREWLCPDQAPGHNRSPRGLELVEVVNGDLHRNGSGACGQDGVLAAHGGNGHVPTFASGFTADRTANQRASGTRIADEVSGLTVERKLQAVNRLRLSQGGFSEGVVGVLEINGRVVTDDVLSANNFVALPEAVENGGGEVVREGRGFALLGGGGDTERERIFERSYFV